MYVISNLFKTLEPKLDMIMYPYYWVCTCSVTKAYLTFCDCIDCSLPGFSVHGISQSRILEWVAISSSRDLPNPEIKSSQICLSTALQDSFPLSHLEAHPYCSVQFSCSVMSNSLRPQGLQHARLLCPSPAPGACSHTYPLSW